MVRSKVPPCRVFLANAPYFLRERYGPLAPVGATLPHLGLLMLGAMLRQSGHPVRIVDASAQGLGYDATVRAARQFRPHIIGLTAVTPSIVKTVKLAGLLKAAHPTAPIILGGPHVTSLPRQTLKDYPQFDYGVVGEGEATMVDLVGALAFGGSLFHIPGLVFRQDDTVHLSPKRAPITDLDTLPFPAWDLLDGFPTRYHPALFKYRRLPSTHMVSARGCPNRCIFCDTSVFGHRVRFHSAEYVLDMMEYLIKTFGMKEIVFEDDQFLLKKKRVAHICEGILRAGWDISWCCSGRVNSVNDPALLRLMGRAGCWQINYGIESANQHILDLARKGITRRQIETAIRMTHQAGILSKGYFIFGLPGETEATMEETIGFAKSIPLTDMSIFSLTPFPGSQMYDIANVHGHMQKDFEHMNLLEVVYVPKGLSADTLVRYQKKFMRRFYLRPRIMVNYAWRLVQNPRNVHRMAKALAGFLRTLSGIRPGGPATPSRQGFK